MDENTRYIYSNMLDDEDAIATSEMNLRIVFCRGAVMCMLKGVSYKQLFVDTVHQNEWRIKIR